MRDIKSRMLFICLIAGFFRGTEIHAEFQIKEQSKKPSLVEPYKEKAILSAKMFSKDLGIGIGDPIKVRMDSLYDGFGTRYLVSFTLNKSSVSRANSCDIGVLFSINEIVGNITDKSCFNFVSPPKNSGMFLLRQYFRTHDLEWEDPVQVHIQGPRLLFQFPSHGKQTDSWYVAVFPNRGEVVSDLQNLKPMQTKSSTAQQSGAVDAATDVPRH